MKMWESRKRLKCIRGIRKISAAKHVINAWVNDLAFIVASMDHNLLTLNHTLVFDFSPSFCLSAISPANRICIFHMTTHRTVSRYGYRMSKLNWIHQNLMRSRLMIPHEIKSFVSDSQLVCMIENHEAMKECQCRFKVTQCESLTCIPHKKLMHIVNFQMRGRIQICLCISFLFISKMQWMEIDVFLFGK